MLDKMKARIIICLLSLFSFLLKGQINLVPNPGFEDSVSCQMITGTYRPNNWYSPKDGSPDYFLISQAAGGCGDSFPDTWGAYNFNDVRGYQLPRTGKGYVGFIYAMFSENIAVELNDTLRQGKKYEVSCYVSLSDNYAAKTIDLIQFEFTPNRWTSYSFYGDLGYFPPFAPDCGNQSGNFIIDTLGWVLVKDTFIANGSEKFLTVGNFDTTATQYYILDSSGTNWGYFYFDDFDVHCIDCSTSIPPVPDYPEITLTPNPGNGNFYLNGNFPPETKIKICNMLGQIVWSEDIESGN